MLPSEITATGSTSGLTGSQQAETLGRDDFLKMLVAQLENQDPLNPQESTEFTAQLAQFSSLEQLISMRESVESLAGVQTSSASSTQALTAAGLIGRDVLAESDALELVSGTPRISFELPQAADETTLVLTTPSGTRQFELGRVSAGRQEIDWSQEVFAGLDFEPGVYQFQVLPTAGDSPFSATTLVRSRVTGAIFTGEEPQLQLGAVAVGLSGVREVREIPGEEAP